MSTPTDRSSWITSQMNFGQLKIWPTGFFINSGGVPFQKSWFISQRNWKIFEHSLRKRKNLKRLWLEEVQIFFNLFNGNMLRRLGWRSHSGEICFQTSEKNKVAKKPSPIIVGPTRILLSYSKILTKEFLDIIIQFILL